MERLIDRFLCIFLTVVLVTALSLGAKKTGAAEFRVEGKNAIVDQAGRKLTIEKPFERIISLYGAHTENLFNLGLFKKIIGVSRHETYPPEALQKPVLLISAVTGQNLNRLVGEISRHLIAVSPPTVAPSTRTT